MSATCASAELTIYRKGNFGSSTVLKYQRGPAPTQRHQRKLKQLQRKKEKTMEGCKRLPDFFRNASSENSTSTAPQVAKPAAPTTELATAPASIALAGNRKGRKKECPEKLKAPIADLEKRLQSKTIDLTGQNSTRHQAASGWGNSAEYGFKCG